MPHSVITSLDDPCLAPYCQLKERELARQGDYFIAEGHWLTQRLASSGLTLVSILCAQERQHELPPELPTDLPVYLLPHALVSQVVGFPFHSGILALGRRPENRRLEELLGAQPAQRGRVLVLPRTINHDNLGALLRTAAALGVTGVLLGEQCADPWYRKCVRVSMGTIFRMPLRCSTDLAADLTELRTRHDVFCAATVLDDAAVPLSRWTPPSGQPIALLLGAEDHGLESQWLAQCAVRLTIPMPPGVDSLNVTIAAGIFLHALMPPLA